MARLAHISDLHFGAHDDKLVAAVERRIDAEKPDLVVASGDFTQRARTAQFKQAGAFVQRIRDKGHVVLTIPGNHDIPLYDIFRRFFAPLTRYRKFINPVLCPFHEIPGAAVLGINTARSATFKDGKINNEQIAFIGETFGRIDPKTPRVLVTHHPIFALPVGGGGIGKPIKNQAAVLNMVGELGLDLLLAGHNHRASREDSSEFVTKSTGALVIQAGTATSTRVRGEKQSFNIIDIDGETVTVTVVGWDGTDFKDGTPARFTRKDDRWMLIGDQGLEPVPSAPREAAQPAS